MSTGMGGDDVYTGRMGPRQNVSNYCSEAQISQIISELSRRAAIPPHIIVWWTGPVNTIPFGWALANGVLNSPANGGSGIVVISKFVRGAASGAGNTEDATETSNDGHYHDVLIAPTETGVPAIQATLMPSKTNIDKTEQATFNPPDATVTGGKGQTKEGEGTHKHEATTEAVAVVLKDDGLHDHANSNTEDAIIAAHDCGDVADCIADHGGHTHNIISEASLTTLEGPGGGEVNITYHAHGASTGAMVGDADMVAHSGDDGGNLQHGADNKHKHTITGVEEAGLHTHQNDPHTHPVLFDEDGAHQHELHDHTHKVEWGEEEHHHHKITDPGHTHPYEPIADPHGHEAVARGGYHEHITGRPDNIKLLPIEKLDVL